MAYPFWDIGISYGILMAAVAVVHVFLAHFAIGGGLYLVIAEWMARRSGSEASLDFVRGVSRFFILATLVMGALTGVGIWFVIGLLSPAATEVLIRNFVWGWAIEWTFFLVEIVAAIVYWYGWGRLSARAHLAVGWIYFVAAWLSLVVINGIVTFMLTPGRWSETGAFIDGFFNPTYAPSLLLRTGICVLLAGLFTLAVAAWRRDLPGRSRWLRANALVSLAGLGISVPAFAWYRQVVNDTLSADILGRLTMPATALDALTWLTLGLGGAVLVLGLALPRLYARPVAVVVLLVGLVWFGAFEWWRESARKPWAIGGYMYGNGLLASHLDDDTRETGLLPQLAFRTGDDGADLFRVSCRHCHSIDGYNGLRPFFDGTDEAFVQASIRGLHKMRTPMPPFAGNAEEAALLGSHLWKHCDQRPFREVHPVADAAFGRKVYEIRCGRCHVIGGHGDKRDSMLGADAELFAELIGEELTETMPVFSGSEEERSALIRYLVTVCAEEDR